MELRKQMVFYLRENKMMEGDTMDLLMKELELFVKKVKGDEYQFSEGERGGEGRKREGKIGRGNEEEEKGMFL